MVTTLCASQCLGGHLGALPALARLSGRHAGGVHVFEAVFRPRTMLPRHEHAHARFSFMLAGSIGESFADQSIRCDRNTLSFHPATIPHRNDIWAGGARALLIEVCADAESDLAGLVRSRTAPFATTQPRLREVAVELGRALRTDHARQPNAVEAIVVEAIALDFLSRALPHLDARVAERRRTPPSWLDELDSFIDERLDTHLSVSGLAARIRVTPRQLATTLQRHRGTTFVALVKGRRLQRAQSLLRDTDLPLSLIALAAGFADQSHLTRCFRTSVGTTPSRFRRQSGTRDENSF